MKQYIRLTKETILKSRYNKFYLINTKNEKKERFLVEDETLSVLRFLLEGNSVKKTSQTFPLSPKELIDFLSSLEKKELIEWVNSPYNSTSKCFDIEPPLDSLNILLTNACNLHCLHCYRESGKKSNSELKGKDWIEVLKQAQNLGVFALNISGGEPLLHPDFWMITEYIASIPTFNANLNTNGTIPIEKNKRKLLSRAFKSIQVSIDHINPEEHDLFRGQKNSWKKAIKTVQQLISWGIKVNIGFTLTPQNFSILEKMVSFCQKIGVSELHIGLLTNIGRGKNLPSVEKNKKFLETVYNQLLIINRLKINIQILSPFRFFDYSSISFEKKKYICDGDNTQILYLLPEGTAVPCDKLPKEIFGYGNIKKQSLLEIWKGKKMRSFKLMKLKNIPKCHRCPRLSICGGPCLARSFWEKGLLNSPDTIACFMAKKIEKLIKGGNNES
ncbi:MAG: radical SAM/SPASM domain-containing protein [Microgenomates group bacterium]